MEIQDYRTISLKRLQTLVKSTFSKPQITSKSQLIGDDENTPPPNPNIQISCTPVSSPKTSKSRLGAKKLLCSNQEVEQISCDVRPGKVLMDADLSVKVLVRIKPEKGADLTVKKVSEKEIRAGDRGFGFDSILDSSSTQEDVFKLVGEPVVRDALAGYNATILSYGQTGSGKTYTMWGPPSAMIEGHSPSTQQGIAPRIFQMLFSEIQKEKAKSNGKQINFQCRCSFLEIYNGEIGDLLDPTQRNLEIRDDAKNGFYVENLSEEYVTSYDDVTQILIKGLSSRKVGTTSLNSKSSRSHVAFTCIIESWSKDAPNSFSSSRTSKISLVDLAGVERLKQEDASRELTRQGKNVKKSVSQLGHLVSILAKGVLPEDGEYKNSSLTHLLRESLGGNAKLSVICTISSDKSNHGETFSTLRFGQRVRSIRNNPVINEITEDDVNDLSDQIRQLKEELIRAKLDVFKPGDSSGQLKGQSIRERVNQMRISLNRSLMLPSIDDDLEEKVDPNDADVTELCTELDNLRRSCEENPEEFEDSMNYASARGSCDTYFSSEHERNCLHESVEVDSTDESSQSTSQENAQSTVLVEPMQSESPKIKSIQKKSIANASVPHGEQSGDLESYKLNSEIVGNSVRPIESTQAAPLHSSKIFSGPTESLAASLKRGLEIIDYHQRNSQLNKSSVAFSFQHFTLRPSPAVDKANASVQTRSMSLDGMPSSTLLCVSCKQKIEKASNGLQDSLLIQAVETNGLPDSGSSITNIAKDAEEGAAKTENRLEELDKVCSEQAAKIEELNRLVEQLKQEKELSPVSKQSEDKGCDSTEIQEAPEISKEKSAMNAPNSEHGSASSYSIVEKEELLQEIKNLKNQLQVYKESASCKSIEQVRSSLLSRSIQLRKSMCIRDNSAEEMEKERERWIELESEWISLTDELRIDIENIRQHSEDVEKELKLEKKLTEELDDALQRSVLGHARMVEHYVELQEKYDDLSEKYSRIMVGVEEVKKAAARAGTKCKGSRYAKALAFELSNLRVEKEKERERLKKENKSLRIQLKDTAEAVHTAGELLVRLREAEEAASAAETNLGNAQEENDRLKKQIEKLKRKHKMEMVTMKQYLAESKLPESALLPMHFEEADATSINNFSEHIDDNAWRTEFSSTYHDNY